MKNLFLLVFLCSFLSIKAQVGIGTTTPDASAALEIKGTKGILIPRMTSSQRIAITSPAEGLMVYQTDATKGYWYYDGSTWKSISSGGSSTGGGKTIIVLSDNITNAEAQAKLTAELGPNTQIIRVVGCTNLTSLDLSSITQLIDLNIVDNPVLQIINASNLQSCIGGDGLSVRDCPLLTTVNFSSLQKVIGTESKDGGVWIQNTKLSTLSFPALIKSAGIAIEDNPSLSSISFGVLANSGGSIYVINNLITSLSFPLLVTAGGINISDNSKLAGISFPVLTTVKDAYFSFTVSDNPLLTSVSFNNLSTVEGNGGVSINFRNNKLPSSQVNYLLNKFVAVTPVITNAFFDFTQVPAAPPTGQGLTDKATLQSRGNNVETD